jgi:DNA-binding response OmpR family regulator
MLSRNSEPVQRSFGLAKNRAVLLVSYNSELLSPYREALAAAGYDTRQCGTLSAALGAVGPGTVDLMVLSPDIPAGDRRRIEAEAKRRNHDIKIVLFYRGEKSKDVFASAMLSLEEAPTALLQMARELVSS